MTETHTTAVIVCACSGCLGEAIDWDAVRSAFAEHPARPRFLFDELACAVDNRAALAEKLREMAPGRVVVMACSPRDHEETFRQILSAAGINPYLMQMIPVREQVAWVTRSRAEATAKATRLLRGALDRVTIHEPLTPRTVPVCPEVVIIGAGPAGLQSARVLLRAGRRVTLIERAPFIGGMAVRFDELFPSLECGSCLLEPWLQEILQAAGDGRLQLLLQAEATRVAGQFGVWHLTVRQHPRFVRTDSCIGCQSCVAACPVRTADPLAPGSDRPAIAAPFAGAQPGAPVLDPASCRQLQDGSCRLCQEVCPVPGTIDFDDTVRELTFTAGAIVVATGAEEMSFLPDGWGGEEDVHTACGFERLISRDGHTGGELVTAAGESPRSLAIVQCAGSLDPEGTFYCSGICCQEALKIAGIARRRVPELAVTRLVREQVVPGPAASTLLQLDESAVVRYGAFRELRMVREEGERTIRTDGQSVPAEMVVLCRPHVPGPGTREIARLFRLPCDDDGFLSPLHPQISPFESARKGIYLAGSCREPGTIRDAVASGSAAAGLVLAELVPGQELVIDPQVAVVDNAACSGCGLCLTLCPYHAISWDEEGRVARILDILCQGCGTCVAACPAGAITARGASRAMLRAELKGVLS